MSPYWFIFVFSMVSVPVHCALDELSTLMTSLWHSDTNAATVSHLHYAYQHHTATTSSVDNAPGRLFTYVDENYLFSKPTYQTFLDLLDNYHRSLGSGEYESLQEVAEEDRFIREIAKTAVIQKTQQFLHQKGYVASSMVDFEKTLHSIWFSLYPRSSHSSTKDSSAFEHVFVGETTGSKIDGFHNWIQFHLEEKKGHLDYLGYIFRSQPGILGVHFKWYNSYKKLSSLIIGSSPEFEVAIYTICYYLHRNRECSFTIDGHHMRIQTYEIDYVPGDQIATAYVN